MTNTLAAKVLLTHLSKIEDGALKTALEIAIESLLSDAINAWHQHYRNSITVKEYLGLLEESYKNGY